MKREISPLAKKLAAAFIAVSAIGYGAHKWINVPNDTITITAPDGQATEVIVQEQKTAGWQEKRYGRGYVIWEGTIIEELNNNTGFDGYNTDYDMNVYDFDLGIIYHTTNASGGGIATTYFNDIAVDGVLPQHIENVKQVGCDLAEGYIEREQSDEYSSPPEDVMYFYRNHCL